MTSTEPTPDGALCDALATEHAVIYGYGMVSAYAEPELNHLVSASIHQHRDRRDRVAALLLERSVDAPIAAAGYALPIALHDTTDAAQLAVRMEDDAATAWRAVVERAERVQDRQFAVTALTQSAVLAARWNQALGNWPIARPFPGGSE